MTDDLAVRIRGAVKNFGRGSRRVAVLDHLDMNVSRGSIYALLGASGCGKTTLLTCVVGQMKLNSGEIFVLGGTPGSKSSGVPGPRVGFMPQELALMKMFTVKETIFYFGWLFGMSNKVLQERYTYLAKLLHLPPENQQVKLLSGGQQRRVSIAAALVHGAELLIMDEPTVGLDPVLRDMIWKHLTLMTRTLNTTIIITTHYIEEARQAHQIGLMRKGKLLDEDNPDKLLIRYNCPSLEAVFLKLSIRQTRGASIIEASEAERLDNVEEVCVETEPQQPEEIPIIEHSNDDELDPWSQSDWREHQPPFLYRMKPLIAKNLYSILRCNGELVQSLVMPVMILALFYWCIGRYPTNLKLAVVNEELNNYTNCEELMRHQYSGGTINSKTCELSAISCFYLSFIDSSIADKVYYPDKQSALQAVYTRNAVGMIYFATNFSRDLQTREEEGRYTEANIVEGSEIQVTLDRNSPQILYLVQMRLLEQLKVLADHLSASCNRTMRAIDIPMQFQDPIYGDERPSVQAYIAPRALILVVFLVSTTVTSTTVVNDRVSGVWGRNLVAGVSLSEILASHLLFQMLLALVYSIESSITVFLVFGEKLLGDIFTMFFMVYLQSACGVCFGLAISVISKDYIVSTFLTVGSFFPLLIFCGLVWPIEGMHFILNKLSIVSPTAISSTSLNHVMQKGWSIVRPAVFVGYLIPVGWMAIFLVFSLLVLRIKE